MQRKAAIINQRELFREFPKCTEIQNYENSFEMYWELLDEFGKGFIYMAQFRPGLVLKISNFWLRENIVLASEHQDALFAFDFTVSGSIEGAFSYEDGSEDTHVFIPEQSGIVWRPKFQCVASFRGKVPIRILTIYLAPFLLKTLMEEQHDCIPADMCDILGGNDEKRYYHPLTTTIATRMIVHEIFNCPYHGNIKRLWLEGKTLELIAHSLVQLDTNKNRYNKVFVLRSDDIECVLDAKDILTHNIENPPSLFELANMVGINKNKLTQGFREIFGTSVFDYLRICRLERGRELLKSGEKNVAGVAFETGYAQQGNFTKAFKRYFGTNPSNYLR